MTIAALAVLVTNDRWAKYEWPGFLTGKLSDIAGLALAPIVALASLVLVGMTDKPALRWTLALGTLAVFTATKSNQAGADLATAIGERLMSPFRSIWGNTTHHEILVDTTDLLCAPAVLAVTRAPGRSRSSV